MSQIRAAPLGLWGDRLCRPISTDVLELLFDVEQPGLNMLIKKGGSLDDERKFMQRELRLGGLFDSFEFLEPVFQAGRWGLYCDRIEFVECHVQAPLGW